jgi:two-component system sensor histidine kinase AtoS
MNSISLPLIAGLIFILIVLLLLSIFFIVKGVMRIERQRKTDEASTSSGQTQMDFMVVTFQELVKKLKENEKELIRLRAAAEDRAQETEKYNEHILQSVSSGVITLDNTFTVKSINAAAQTILRLQDEDIINKYYSEVFSGSFCEYLKKKEPIVRAECAYTISESENLWLGLSITPLKDKRSKVLGVVVVFTDLTEIKELQLRIEIKERLTHLGEMSAGIAHELRNPMAVVAGYAKLLKKKIAPSLIPTVDSIINEINVIDKIISQFLTFAKPSELNLSQVNISALLFEEARLIKDNDTDMTLEIEENLTIEGDEILLRQALKNLIDNAQEAMPDGGHLTIRSQRKSPNSCEIVISDTGSGMSDEVKEKIFLPFYTTKQSGTGLGLALVQKIIISHNGSISVESKEGEGAAFKIKFPLIT